MSPVGVFCFFFGGTTNRCFFLFSCLARRQSLWSARPDYMPTIRVLFYLSCLGVRLGVFVLRLDPFCTDQCLLWLHSSFSGEKYTNGRKGILAGGGPDPSPFLPHMSCRNGQWPCAYTDVHLARWLNWPNIRRSLLITWHCTLIKDSTGGWGWSWWLWWGAGRGKWADQETSAWTCDTTI